MAIALGLIAAFGWGLHDILVRYVSQKTPICASLLVVLLFGAFFQFLAITVRSDFGQMPTETTGIAIIAGILFMSASIGLYKAFEIGPVGLVAPIIASFSILSVLWGTITGQPATLVQWIAVFAVLTGITIVASLTHDDDSPQTKGGRNTAICWSLLASVSFAANFGLGQSIMETAPDLLIIFIIRIAAIVSLLAVMFYVKSQIWPARNQLPILAAIGLLDAIAHTSVLSAGNYPNANFASVATSAFGMITIILAWLLLKERMTGKQWGGVCLAFAGIAYLAL